MLKFYTAGSIGGSSVLSHRWEWMAVRPDTDASFAALPNICSFEVTVLNIMEKNISQIAEYFNSFGHYHAVFFNLKNPQSKMLV